MTTSHPDSFHLEKLEHSFDHINLLQRIHRSVVVLILILATDEKQVETPKPETVDLVFAVHNSVHPWEIVSDQEKR